MNKYALIFTGGKMATDPEEIKKIMDNWSSWYTSMGEGLVDYGSAFMPHVTTKIVTKDEIKSGSSSTGVSGYTIVQGDENKVEEFAKNCPIIADGGAVEIHQFMQIG